MESICYRTRANQLINNTTGWLRRKIWMGGVLTIGKYSGTGLNLQLPLQVTRDFSSQSHLLFCKYQFYLTVSEAMLYSKSYPCNFFSAIHPYYSHFLSVCSLTIADQLYYDWSTGKNRREVHKGMCLEISFSTP